MRTQGQIALLNALDLALEKGRPVRVNWSAALSPFEIEQLTDMLVVSFDAGRCGPDVPYAMVDLDGALCLCSMNLGRKNTYA